MTSRHKSLLRTRPSRGRAGAPTQAPSGKLQLRTGRGPRVGNVQQGRLGKCSIVAAIAGARPDLITSSVSVTEDGQAASSCARSEERPGRTYSPSCSTSESRQEVRRRRSRRAISYACGRRTVACGRRSLSRLWLQCVAAMGTLRSRAGPQAPVHLVEKPRLRSRAGPQGGLDGLGPLVGARVSLSRGLAEARNSRPHHLDGMRWPLCVGRVLRVS